jgi:hypothetical protein
MSEGRTTGDERDTDEIGGLVTSVSQFQLRDRPWPNRTLGPTSRDMLPGEPGITDSEQLPALDYRYAPREPRQEQLPVQSVVDRAVPLEPTFVDIKLMSGSKVVAILRDPEFGNYGFNPSDPGWFSEAVNPRTAVCTALAPYAAARCLAGVGYW